MIVTLRWKRITWQRYEKQLSTSLHTSGSHWRLRVLPPPIFKMRLKRLFRMPENTLVLEEKATRRSGTSSIQLQMQASGLTFYGFVSSFLVFPSPMAMWKKCSPSWRSSKPREEPTWSPAHSQTSLTFRWKVHLLQLHHPHHQSWQKSKHLCNINIRIIISFLRVWID